jgi:hypothetical protein
MTTDNIDYFDSDMEAMASDCMGNDKEEKGKGSTVEGDK